MNFHTIKITRLAVATLNGLLISIVACAQGPNALIPIVDDQLGIIHEFPLRSPGETGSVYLSDEWRQTNLKLGKRYKNDVLEGLWVKLDMRRNLFEIKTGTDVKILNGSDVEGFDWITPDTQERETFSNCNQFTLNDYQPEGFCQILVTGDMRLVQEDLVEVKRANYSAILDTGNKDDELVKKQRLLITTSGDLLPADKRTLFENFTGREDEMKAFVKDNKLKLSRKADLQTVIAHYNSLKEGS